MLNHIPPCIPPEALPILWNMGHCDTLLIAGANFPAARIVGKTQTSLIQIPGSSILQVLDAILTLMPADTYTQVPLHLKKGVDPAFKNGCEAVISKHDSRGSSILNELDGNEFQTQIKKVCCIIQTGDLTPASNLIFTKGAVHP